MQQKSIRWSSEEDAPSESESEPGKTSRTMSLWDDEADAPDESGEEETPTPVMTAQTAADALMKATRRPRTSQDPKTMKATARRSQARLVAMAKRTGDDAIIGHALQFEVGRTAYPTLAALARATSIEDQLCKNIATLIESTGKHNRNHVTRKLTTGIPSLWAKTRLGVSGARLRSARESRHVRRWRPPHCGS